VIVVRILLLVVFLFPVPALLGAPWTALLPDNNRHRLCAFFSIGFFVELAIFQLLELPMAFLRLPFSALCWVFGVVVAACCAYSVVRLRKNRPFALRLPRMNGWEQLYLVVFLGLLCWQVFNGFVRDTTYWSYDDAAYVTYAADAIRYNAIQTIDPYTGIGKVFNAHRALQGWLYFPGFLSLISGVSVATMERTVLEAYDILLAYSVFVYMASVLFKRKDNCLIFLIFLSLLHIFGWYSPYSVTFRLLGPNYQGKAVIAVSLFPLLFTFLIQILNRPYMRQRGLLLLLFSTAAASLTLFGAVTVILNTTLVVILSLFHKRRRWKHLWYIPWSGLVPALCCGIYFLFKYGRF